MTERVRLDLALARRGLARSRSHARALIAADRVRLDGRPVTRAAVLVGADSGLEVADDGWVSRAAHKLLGALEDLAVPAGATCGRALDAGASTGGFSQVLLRRGCDPVYAVDVGHGQLAPSLRADPRVRVREGLNLRQLALTDLDDEPVGLIVADVSFISLRLLLPALTGVAAPGAHALLMVKPQFEVGRQLLGKGGVVRDEGHRERAVEEVERAARDLGWLPRGRARSRLPGPAGNVEFFVAMTRPVGPGAAGDERPGRASRGVAATP